MIFLWLFKNLWESALHQQMKIDKYIKLVSYVYSSIDGLMYLSLIFLSIY